MNSVGPTSHILSSLARISRRVHARQSLTIAVLLCATRLVAVEPIKVYPSLTLKDGRQFAAVEIINYTSGGILVRHSRGATTFRLEVLPDDVIAALHLKNWQVAETSAFDPALADRPAVAEGTSGNLSGAEHATIPALAAATVAMQPEVRAAGATPVAADSPSPAPAAQETAQPGAPNAAPTPSGEGNMPEFFAAQNTEIVAPKSDYVNLGGRVVVTSPAGEIFLLGDVEVRGYPANLLASYLEQAKAQCNAAVQKLLDQATAAATDGRSADYASLTAQAKKIASRYLDNLPIAPFSARTDAYGNFTLRHNLRDLRIVAAGRVVIAGGEWNYEWTAVVPDKEANLTEANATAIAVASVAPNLSKYAAK